MMMNSKRGEIGMVGTILVVAIAIIVGVILFTAVAQEAGRATNTVSINETITSPANGGIYNFTDYRNLGGVSVVNASNGVAIAAGNYTITGNVLSPTTGALTTTLTVEDAEFAGWSWFVIATSAQPLTYIEDSGSRSVVALILILLAVAIALVALFPVIKGGALELFSR